MWIIFKLFRAILKQVLTKGQVVCYNERIRFALKSA